MTAALPVVFDGELNRMPLKIKYCHIGVNTRVQRHGPVVDHRHQLCFTRVTLTKAMLTRSQCMIFLKKLAYTGIDDVLK